MKKMRKRRRALKPETRGDFGGRRKREQNVTRKLQGSTTKGRQNGTKHGKDLNGQRMVSAHAWLAHMLVRSVYRKVTDDSMRCGLSCTNRSHMVRNRDRRSM